MVVSGPDSRCLWKEKRSHRAGRARLLSLNLRLTSNLGLTARTARPMRKRTARLGV